MAGEQLDLSSSADDDPRGRTGRPGRVLFSACTFAAATSTRASTLARERAAYHGHCPRCSRPLLVRIGPNGSDSRFFEAG